MELLLCVFACAISICFRMNFNNNNKKEDARLVLQLFDLIYCLFLLNIEASFACFVGFVINIGTGVILAQKKYTCTGNTEMLTN